ncbi:MAG: NmrA/HSCARG family protein [Candidatus Marinimicrobia bacterium]|nr:NmrA/HSCARG family protein [Candidatus Neomarinimicrobiota bacterium]
MSQSINVLVTGATGNQGGAVVQALLNRGHQVRALTRNSASPAADRLREQGVEIAVGDFSDQDSLVRAARGVDAVYAMATPFEGGVEQETAQGIAVADAAKAAGVGHLVYSSVASADRATGIPHFESKYEIEKHILSSGVPYTIIAPVFFMDNMLLPWVLPGLRQGKLAMAMPATRSLQQIAVADVGDIAASVFERRDAFIGRRIDIAGDEPTGDEAAAILSKVTGREIRYEGFSPDVLRAESEDMALMFEWFDTTGYAADIKGLRRDFPDVKWHTFEEWAHKQDWTVLDRSSSEIAT